MDVVKDRLYTFAPKSAERRSAQTAMWRIVEALTRLIAPILSFTAEEVWQYLPKIEGREESVHLALFPEVAEIVPGSVASIENDWAKLLGVRQSVMVELERMRANKEIGKGLDASVKILVAEGSPLASVLMKYESSLTEFFNVSQASVQAVASKADAAVAEVEVAQGAKCARCWRVVPDVGVDARWSEVCGRCAEALDAIGFEAAMS
jgi:isoleucyl-tRNA synthetase